MIFQVFRRIFFLSLVCVCGVFVFSAIGFALVVEDDFETVDPFLLSDGMGSEISGGKLRSNYDSFTWYEDEDEIVDTDLLDFHVEVFLTPNAGQSSANYDPNFPAGTHLALAGRGHLVPIIIPEQSWAT